MIPQIPEGGSEITEEGLHLRPAARLVRLAQKFRSSICLRANGRMADARSIISIMLLCAVLGTVIEVEAAGDDEDLAVQALENAFVSTDTSPDVDTDTDADIVDAGAEKR